jgi:hypothetical protein
VRWLVWLRHPAVEAAALVTAALSGIVGLLAGWSSGHFVVPAAKWWVCALWLGIATGLAGSRRRWTLVGWGLWVLGWPPLAAGIAAFALVERPSPWRGDPPLGRTLLGLTLRWPLPDRLLHAHVLGPTGSGKSRRVLLPWMKHDLDHGRAFTLIEPKGDLVALVRSYARRVGGKLVVFDPLDPDCPHFNPLAGDAAAAGEGLALALDQLDPAAHPFYRTVGRVLLVQVVRAVKAERGEGADLAAVLAALREPRRLDEASARLADGETQAYFRAEWGALPPSRRHELMVGLVHRVRALLLHPAVARVLSPPFDFDWEEVLREGWCVLAPLNAGALGAGARALGTLLWHLMVQAAYRRGPSASLVHTVYLDEFHQYVAPDLADVLAMVRGYGLSVVLAHQDLGQLTPALAEAVLANARTRVVLAGVSGGDVSRLSAEAAPHRYPSPRYLPPGWAVVTRTVRGRLDRPRIVRLPPVGGLEEP